MEPLVYGDLVARINNPGGGGGPAGGARGGSGGGGAEPSPVSAGPGTFSEAVQPSEAGGSSGFSDARAPTAYRYSNNDSWLRWLSGRYLSVERPSM